MSYTLFVVKWAFERKDYIETYDLNIRDARTDEGNYLTELALRSKAHWGYSEAFIEACRPHIYVDVKYIGEWPVVVAEVNSQIVGFFSLKTIGEEDRLDNLWVEPEYIQCGYGRRLFVEAIDRAKLLGWSYFRLAGEPSSVPFYKKMGAVEIGEIQSRLRNDIFLPHMEYTL